MTRGLISVLCTSALVVTTAAGATAGNTTSAAGSRSTATVITLRGRSPTTGAGAWQRRLRLKLIKVRLKSFELCAMVNHSTLSPTCDTKPSEALPRGTILRLEQRPAGHGIKVRDTPGWGMVGTSLEPSILAVLSNVVTGNTFGTVTYRVTLRDAEGKILARSKRFEVTWHR
jgi:hypothetical protein